MAKIKKPKKSDAPENFPQKLWDKLPVTWRDGINSKSFEELKVELINAEKLIDSTENAMSDDEKITSAKEVVKDLSSGYTDVIKLEKAKVKFCLYTLEQRGNI